jgi:hypothetical protein
MAHAPTRHSALVAVAVVLATLVPAASASAAKIRIKAPDKIDQAEKFRVVAKGTGKPNKHYGVSVVYHNDDQGKCEPTVGEEITRNTYYSVLYLYPVTTDKDGKYKVTSRKIFGGAVNSGKLCGYLTTKNGDTKATAVRHIEFT